MTRTDRLRRLETPRSVFSDGRHVILAKHTGKRLTALKSPQGRINRQPNESQNEMFERVFALRFEGSVLWRAVYE